MPPDRTLPPKFSIDTSHMLARPEATGKGLAPLPRPSRYEAASVGASRPATIGTILRVVGIILLLAFGALYFWGGYLNSQDTEGARPAPSAGA